MASVPISTTRITDYRVVHGGETIGFVTLHEGTYPSRRYSNYLRIVDLAIDDEYRNRGHGTEVVDRVKETARTEKSRFHLRTVPPLVSC